MSMISRIFVSGIVLMQFLMACASRPDTTDSKRFNLGFEQSDSSGAPSFWISGYNDFFAMGYKAECDSTTKHSGKYSLKVSFTEKTPSSTIVYQAIPISATGKEITLSGYVKTENVSGGYAGLYLKLNGENGLMGRDLMDIKRGVSGNSGWEKLTIKLPFSKGVELVTFGITLNGKGTCWWDDLSVSIDGEDLTTVLVDSTSPGSHPPQVLNADLSDSGRKVQVEGLAAVCQVWGFLKYHHPLVTSGKYDWDQELLRVLPAVTFENDPQKVKAVIEKWVTQYQFENAKHDKDLLDTSGLYIRPDYGDIFRPGFLPVSVTEQMERMRIEHRFNPGNYYVDTNAIGVPTMAHERIYPNPEYPTSSYRLLSLFRYYNFVQYFYPYRSQLTSRWADVLRVFIPKFLATNNVGDYVLCCAQLIARINDTHAQVYNENKYFNAFLGKYFPPFQPIFIKDELVVGEFNDETERAKRSVSKGDVIKSINGKSVSVLVNQYANYISASNRQVLLRDIARMILRGNAPEAELELMHDGVLYKKRIALQSTYEKYLRTTTNSELPPSHSMQYEGKQLFYINGSKLNKQVIDTLKQGLTTYTSVLLDLRSNISFDHLQDMVNILKSGRAPFAIYVTPRLVMPGAFKISYSTNYNNWGTVGNSPFSGKIILLVNENTQSAGEYFAMAFQGNSNTITVGTTTAGTDGNIAIFNLPGFISTGFSGIGVLYPNKTTTQGNGIRIDIPVEITVKGFVMGKDEILQKAIEVASK